MRALSFIGIVLLCGCRTEPSGLSGSDTSPDGGANVDLALPGGCAALTDEAACIADNACVAVTLCGTGEFQACVDPGSPRPKFGPFCYITRCGLHTDEASCSADSSCHATFYLDATKDCATVRCEYTFFECAPGVAECVPPRTTKVPCEGMAPTCIDPFVPEYDSQTGCSPDCVLKDECPET